MFLEKLAEKRLVPLSHLRPLYVASPHCDRYSRDYTKSRSKYQRIANFTTDASYNCDAICNSGFDFEPYINLANFELSPTNAYRELITYPIYSQSGAMNPKNGNNPSHGGNSKSMKNRQSNTVQHQTNDGGDDKVTTPQNDTDNDGNGAAGASGGVQQYGKNAHESKIDSQQPTSSSTTGHQQSYHPHQHHQMPEPNDGALGGMLPVATTTPSGHLQPISSYYHHQGAMPVSSAPIYYYQADEQIYTPSDMVVPHGVYAVPAAYQPTTTAAGPPSMQPNMYTPAITSTQAGHYPAVQVANWPPFTQTMNPQGKLHDFFYRFRIYKDLFIICFLSLSLN